ncbi:MAG: pyridoxamine 5'-phosphate oxidase family protein [Sporichthyaceae bacterium]|nr:pyridoxamine 5'-phosphate oxidase family protein [Sporichthyaceae bacterium]
MSSYPVTGRTTPTRHRERVGYEVAKAYAVLDAGYLCHVGFVVDGAPVVLPTVYARVGERLYLHGSTGARWLLRGAEDPAGLPVCVVVTLLDGLVLSRSAFGHSVNYRSVVVHGAARPITDPAEQAAALAAVVDQVIPGRATDCRPPTAKELSATAVLRVDLAEVSVKIRTGGPLDQPDDDGLPYWAGVIPLGMHADAPIPVQGLSPDVRLPGYLEPGALKPARAAS